MDALSAIGGIMLNGRTSAPTITCTFQQPPLLTSSCVRGTLSAAFEVVATVRRRCAIRRSDARRGGALLDPQCDGDGAN